MDFLGPDYQELLPKLEIYKDNHESLLQELIDCEPRASIALYPEPALVAARVPEPPQLAKTSTVPDDADGTAVGAAPDDDDGKEKKRILSKDAPKDKGKGKGKAKARAAAAASLTSESSKSKKKETNEAAGGNNEKDNSKKSEEDIDMEYTPSLPQKVDEDASATTAFPTKPGPGSNLHDDDIVLISETTSEGNESVPTEVPQLESKPSHNLGGDDDLLPQPKHLDIYFALYIWTNLAVGSYLDALSIAKRYRTSHLFKTSPLVHFSVRAALAFEPATYSHSLEAFLTPIPVPAPDIESELRATQRAAGLVDYTSIYSLQDLYSWDTHDEPPVVSSGGTIAEAEESFQLGLKISTLVQEAIVKFRKNTYKRIVASFGAIRPATLITYLGLAPGLTAQEIVDTLDKGREELGETSAGKWQIKDGEANGNAVLVPPSAQTVAASRATKSDSLKSEEKKAQMQDLINAATHLEQRLGI